MYLYSHYSGAGNSFFLLDNRKNDFPLEAVSSICQENSIDGMIFLESSQMAHYKMRIFNSDGSEAEMCGNGLRCFIKYLEDLGLIETKYLIETKAGIHTGWIENQSVCIRMCTPSSLKWHVMPDVHFLNTGVPHAVVFVKDVNEIDIEKKGPELRFHPVFSPAGANVNFVSLRDKTSILLRTYERGVERETLACGTGAVAAALATSHLFSYPSPIEVYVRSKEKLKISFTPGFQKVEMEGPATCLKKGWFSLNDNFSIMHAL